MNITIVTAIQGRHDLTEIVLRYYSGLQLNAKDDISLLAVGSEWDASKELVERCGWNYVEYPNEPLSQKFNHVFQCAKVFNPDLLILVGSDDLVSYEVIDWYARNVPRDCREMVGLQDLYFYGIQDGDTVLFPGYIQMGYGKAPRTIGAGRCFSRRILEIMDWRPWQNERVPRGLDSSSTAQMKKRGIGERCVTMAETGGIAVDIKHPLVNLTRWGLLNDPARRCDEKILHQYFPEQMAAVKLLRKKTTFEDRRIYRVYVPKQDRWIDVSGETARDLANKGLIDVT